MTTRKHMKLSGLGIATLSLLSALFFSAAHAQQMYRWVDQNGRVTYSQNPPPAGAAKNVQQRRYSGSVVEGANLPYAAQVAMKNFPVTLFTSPDCGPACPSAREALNKRGIPFKEIVAGDDDSIEALRKLSGGTRVPTLQVGSQVSAGFEISTWNTALDQAGYPASIPASVRRQDPRAQQKLPPVKLYTAAQCGPPCQSAKELLDARGVAYQESIVESEASVEELKKATGGVDILPVMLVGGSQVKGFDPQRYNSVLDNAGFQRPGAAKK